MGFSDMMMGYSITVIPVPVIQVQARRHPRKKRRLQKKWLKRYGLKSIVDPKVDLQSVMVDERNRRIYCYPHQEMHIRTALMGGRRIRLAGER